MYNLVFNAFGIALTAVAIYGVMNSQIADGICFGFGAVAMALIANFVEAKSIWKQAARRGAENMTAAAVALGLAIPALIFAFMRLGAALWFDVQNRG
jgi:uncharacterized membrane protein